MMEINKENMIRQQIIPLNIKQAETISTLNSIPREYFVETKYKHLAYADYRIPLSNNTSMLNA